MSFIDKVRKKTKEAQLNKEDIKQQRAEDEFEGAVNIIKDEIEQRASEGYDTAYLRNNKAWDVYVWKKDKLEEEFPGFKFTIFDGTEVKVDW